MVVRRSWGNVQITQWYNHMRLHRRPGLGTLFVPPPFGRTLERAPPDGMGGGRCRGPGRPGVVGVKGTGCHGRQTAETGRVYGRDDPVCELLRNHTRGREGRTVELALHDPRHARDRADGLRSRLRIRRAAQSDVVDSFIPQWDNCDEATERRLHRDGDWLDDCPLRSKRSHALGRGIDLVADSLPGIGCSHRDARWDTSPPAYLRCRSGSHFHPKSRGYHRCGSPDPGSLCVG